LPREPQFRRRLHVAGDCRRQAVRDGARSPRPERRTRHYILRRRRYRQGLCHLSYVCPEYGRHSDGDKGIYAGPCSTPELDESTGWLYTLSIDGDLNCWDTRASGRKRWGQNLYDEYAAAMRPRVGRSGRRDYGYTSLPLVQGDTLIVEVGAADAERHGGNLIGFDKRTGRRLSAGGPA
jgi:hypothetical protein